MKKLIKKILKEYYADDSVIDLIKDYMDEHMGYYEDSYTVPYTDEYMDFKISYSVDKIRVWEDTSSSKTQYEGTIYLKINRVLAGDKSEDYWEEIDFAELPERLIEDIQDSISDELHNWLSINVDVWLN
jgi:hypothetical protein